MAENPIKQALRESGSHCCLSEGPNREHYIPCALCISPRYVPATGPLAMSVYFATTLAVSYMESRIVHYSFLYS